jgi:hypothetical protein
MNVDVSDDVGDNETCHVDGDDVGDVIPLNNS